MSQERTLTLFADSDRVTTGSGSQIARTVIRLRVEGEERTLLAFDDATGAQIDIDPRDADRPDDGDAPESPRKPGRPKLGVTSREVTLLPRHWEWLSAQPGGASVTLRKLVEKARRDGEAHDRIRRAQGAAHAFMAAIAGNQPDYEDALRALYAGDAEMFAQLTNTWPIDVREYATRLAQQAF